MAHMSISGCTFMQDGALCHRSRTVIMQVVAGQCDKALEWPGKSSDFNPLENAWCFLKDKVSEHRPSNIEDLRTII